MYYFLQNSIRTRVTFEKGIQELGGKTILFPPSALDKKDIDFLKQCLIVWTLQLKEWKVF